jgi:undecaprenyl-diphosphatase
MDLVQAIVLAIVQGLSEFLPISSSGHLVLIPHFLGWTDQGLAFDVAVHIGTLAALLVYFWRQLWSMAGGWVASVTRGEHTRDSRLAWQLLVATIPVGLVGLLFNDFIEENLRNPLFVATSNCQARRLSRVCSPRVTEATQPPAIDQSWRQK